MESELASEVRAIVDARDLSSSDELNRVVVSKCMCKISYLERFGVSLEAG